MFSQEPERGRAVTVCTKILLQNIRIPFKAVVLSLTQCLVYLSVERRKPQN